MTIREGQIRDEDDDNVAGAETTQRLDKWLWFARLAKTRSLAQKLVLGGHVRVERQRTIKPSQLVRPGTLVSVLVAQRLRLLRVVAIGSRRGPAPEASALYDDIGPASAAAPQPATRDDAGKPQAAGNETSVSARPRGSGRPTKLERRQVDRLRRR